VSEEREKNMKKFNFKKPDFSKVKEKFKDIRQDKKKLAIWIASGVAVIALIICAVIFVPGAVKGNAASHSDTASSNKVTATTTKKNSTKTDKKDSKAAAFAKPSASAASTSSPETAASQENTEAAAEGDSSNSSSNSENSGTGSSSGKSGSTVSQGSKPASSSSNSSSGSKTSNTSGSSSKSQTCKTVHHDATGHYENTTTQQWVQDSAAWDETVVDQAAWDEPIYSWDAILHCKYCGYETYNVDDMIVHCASEGSTYESRAFKVQTGTQHHDAVTHVVHHDATGHYETVVTGQQWVQDSAAWDETVCN
jgi:cell division septation protein DedD